MGTFNPLKLVYLAGVRYGYGVRTLAARTGHLLQNNGGSHVYSSTVSKLSFPYVQWRQEITLFPVIEACTFVAL